VVADLVVYQSDKAFSPYVSVIGKGAVVSHGENSDGFDFLDDY